MQLEAFLNESYGLSGRLTRLGGELDENYLLEGDFGRSVFKLMRPDCNRAFIEMQIEAHRQVHAETLIAKHDGGQPFQVPEIIPNKAGETLVTVPFHDGNRLGWMVSHLSGTLMDKARPWTPALCKSIGRSLALLGKMLGQMTHPELTRPLRWDLRQAAWIKEKKHLFVGDEREVVDTHVTRLDTTLTLLEKCPRAVIHNDANEMNIFIEDHEGEQHLSGLIDFGDMCFTARICEAAVAAAYAMMDADDPLANAAAVLSGYHEQEPLQPTEIELFFSLIETRLVVSVTNSAERKLECPDDSYQTLSEAPAWRLLKRFLSVDRELIRGYFRITCGLDASPTSAAVNKWLMENSGKFSPVFPSHDLETALKLDLSFGSPTAINLPEEPDTKKLNARIKQKLESSGAEVAIGGWGEARPIYTGQSYGHSHSVPLSPVRTHHLGVDISVATGVTVHAPYDGKVWAAGNAPDALDYGGYVILEHATCSGEPFYSLYGHLGPNSCKRHRVGTHIAAGSPLGTIGSYAQNGGWWPHLHLQLMTETPVRDRTPPGACEPELWRAAKQLYPNPAAILNLAANTCDWTRPDLSSQRQRREEKSLPNQKLSYYTPLQVSRGWKHFLWDLSGRTYIDAYNNVPHVGHANPHVVRAVTNQMELVSTNTRYLHETLMSYAERLTAKLPSSLSKCLFTSSASEANELAIRLARKATGNTDILVMEHGYHGITTGAMAISPYKFTQKGGETKENWVHVTPQPDPYRGRYATSENVATDCVNDTQKIIDTLQKKGRQIAGFISECLPSVGGQIVMPQGTLPGIYSAVRNAGGVCIADDVQTSLGRLGHSFWGFEYQQAVPDILVLGKPLGNGHPLAAVITTQEIAAAFAEGPELFSTFGGSTVSCAAGLAVLEVLETDHLQENARRIGSYLEDSFNKLMDRYAIIGDVRGAGLFWGLDLVLDHNTREPATAAASYIKNRLFERRILIGTDGPFDNVLKIRPPMTFNKPAADALLLQLSLVLSERMAQP